MDSIKTHCYATFGSMAAAERAIAALQDLQWPVQSFKRLEAKMGDMSAEEVGGVFHCVTTHRAHGRLCTCVPYTARSTLGFGDKLLGTDMGYIFSSKPARL